MYNMNDEAKKINALFNKLDLIVSEIGYLDLTLSLLGTFGGIDEKLKAIDSVAEDNCIDWGE